MTETIRPTECSAATMGGRRKNQVMRRPTSSSAMRPPDSASNIGHPGLRSTAPQAIGRLRMSEGSTIGPTIA